jgi:hypothetical protein
VSGRRSSPYWLHLDASSQATLDDLDRFLRDIWLECCGHLSVFQLGDRSFSGSSLFSSPFDDDGHDESTAIRLGKLLSPGQKLSYEYDFGSTTSLEIRVLAEREGAVAEPIAVLARNNPLVTVCVGCGQAATMSCIECAYEDAASLCDACATVHVCGEEMLLPIVNSPRNGICGYTG